MCVIKKRLLFMGGTFTFIKERKGKEKFSFLLGKSTDFQLSFPKRKKVELVTLF